jgi:hypothetical protein
MFSLSESKFRNIVSAKLALLVFGLTLTVCALTVSQNLYVYFYPNFSIDIARWIGSIMFYGGIALCIGVAVATRSRWGRPKQLAMAGSLVLIACMLITPIASALTPLPSDTGPNNSSAYKRTVPISMFEWFIAEFRDGTYYAVNGSDWNIMTIVEPWQAVAPWAALSTNLTGLTEQCLSVTSSGVVYLKQVAFDLALMNSIPVNVKVACSYQDQYCEYINPADSTGSPYTITVGAGLNVGKYQAEDSKGRIAFSSTDCAVVFNSITTIAETNNIPMDIEFTAGTFIGDDMNIPTQVTVRGAGIGVTNIQRNHVDKSIFILNQYAGTPFKWQGYNEISDINFVDKQTEHGTAPVIYIEQTRNSTFARNCFSNFTSDCYYITTQFSNNPSSGYSYWNNYFDNKFNNAYISTGSCFNLTNFAYDSTISGVSGTYGGYGLWCAGGQFITVQNWYLTKPTICDFYLESRSNQTGTNGGGSALANWRFNNICLDSPIKAAFIFNETQQTFFGMSFRDITLLTAPGQSYTYNWFYFENNGSLSTRTIWNSVFDGIYGHPSMATGYALFNSSALGAVKNCTIINNYVTFIGSGYELATDSALRYYNIRGSVDDNFIRDYAFPTQQQGQYTITGDGVTLKYYLPFENNFTYIPATVLVSGLPSTATYTWNSSGILVKYYNPLENITITPTTAGGRWNITVPSDLTKITDGNLSTSASIGTTLTTTGSTLIGAFDCDLGYIPTKPLTFKMTFGITTNHGSPVTTLILYSSTDAFSTVTQNTGQNAISCIGSLTELIRNAQLESVTTRYTRLSFTTSLATYETSVTFYDLRVEGSDMNAPLGSIPLTWSAVL